MEVQNATLAGGVAIGKNISSLLNDNYVRKSLFMK